MQDAAEITIECPECEGARYHSGTYYTRPVHCDRCGSTGAIETIETTDEERAIVAAFTPSASLAATLAKIEAAFGVRP